MRRNTLLCGPLLLLLMLAPAGPASALDTSCASGRSYGYCLSRPAAPVAGAANAYLGRSYEVQACGSNAGETRYNSWSGWDWSNGLALSNGKNLITHMTGDDYQESGCPWGAAAYGTGAGLWTVTTPTDECHSGTAYNELYCDDASLGYKTASNIPAGFSFSAPAGTAIGQINAAPTFLTQTELSERLLCNVCTSSERVVGGNGTYQTIPHWGAWFSADGAGSANAIRGCYDYYNYPDAGASANRLRIQISEGQYLLGTHAGDNVLYQCNSYFDGNSNYTFNAGGSITGWNPALSPALDTSDTSPHYWYRPLLAGGGLPTTLYVVLQCYTTPCTDFWGVAQSAYNSRMNLKGAGVSLVDQQDPSNSNLGGSLISAGWRNGTYDLTATQSDNTGIIGDQVSPGGPNNGGLIDHAGDTTICNNRYSGNTWYVTQPCVLSRSGTWSVNACAAGDGPSRTFTLTTYDPAGNATSTNATANVDCSPPTISDPAFCDAGTGLRVFAVDSGYIATGSWLKRGSIQVRGSGCDTSPMGSGTVEVRSSSDNSGWSGAVTTGISNCSFPNGVGAAQDSELRCNFDTSVFAEGTYVQFRVRMTSTGGTGYSAWGSSYRVDNTANRPGLISWSPALSTPNRWTNRRSITASWTPDTSGSPITAVWYTYQPGPSGSGACALGAATLLDAAASSVVLANSPTVACQQGTHTLNVWQVDASGNGSSAFARTDTYRYDSVVPDAPTNGSVTPSGWSTVNSFRVDYTNPLIVNTATESPFVWTYHRIGTQDPPSADSTCLGSGVTCTVNSITVPPVGGAYSYRTWLEDEAGNRGEELNLTLRYNDSQCPR